MSTPISGDNSNSLYISRQMADALKNKKDVVDNILKDGVNSADKQAMKDLRAELELAAKADDGIINADEKSLLNSLDSNGMFGTSYESVEKNLKALKQVYDTDPNQVNFNGAQLTTEDGFTSIFGAEQSRVIRIREDNVEQYDPDHGTPPTLAEGETPVHTNTPVATPVVQGATPKNSLTQPAEQARQELVKPITELQQQLNEPTNPILLKSITDTVKEELPNATPEAVEAEVQTRLTNARTAVNNYVQAPSSENLSALYQHIGIEPEFTHTQDPKIATILREVQAGIKTSKDLQEAGKTVESNISNQYFKSADTPAKLQQDLNDKIVAAISSGSAFETSAKNAYDLVAEMKSLKETQPNKFAEIFPNLDDAAFKELDTLSQDLMTQAMEGDPSSVNAETMAKLNRLAVYTNQLKPNLSNLDVTDTLTEPLRAANQAFTEGAHLSSAAYNIETALTHKAQVQMELQTARQSLQAALSQNLPEMTKVEINNQIGAINKALDALENNVALTDEDNALLKPVLTSLQEAKASPTSLDYFGFGGFGSYSNFGGSSSSLYGGGGYSLPSSSSLIYGGSSPLYNSSAGIVNLNSSRVNLPGGNPLLGTNYATIPGLDIGGMGALQRGNVDFLNTASLGTPRLTSQLFDTTPLANNNALLTGGMTTPNYLLSPQPLSLTPQTFTPSLDSKLQANANKTALDNLLADPAIQGKYDTETIKTMMEDRKLDDQTKLYIQNSLYAAKQTADGHGEQRIGSPGAKAKDLANDLSFIVSGYKAAGTPEEKSLQANFVTDQLIRANNNPSANNSGTGRAALHTQATSQWSNNKNAIMLSSYLESQERKLSSNDSNKNRGAQATLNLVQQDPELKAALEAQKPSQYSDMEDWMLSDTEGFKQAVSNQVKVQTETLNEQLKAGTNPKGGVSNADLTNKILRLQEIDKAVTEKVNKVKGHLDEIAGGYDTEIASLDAMEKSLPKEGTTQARQFIAQQREFLEQQKTFATTGVPPAGMTPGQFREKIIANHASRQFVFENMELANSNPEHRTAITGALEQTLQQWSSGSGMSAKTFGSKLSENLSTRGVNINQLTYPPSWTRGGGAPEVHRSSTSNQPASGANTDAPATNDGQVTPPASNLFIQRAEDIFEEATNIGNEVTLTAKASHDAIMAVKKAKDEPLSEEDIALSNHYRAMPAQLPAFDPDAVIAPPPAETITALTGLLDEYTNSENPDAYFKSVVTPMSQTFSQIDNNLLNMMQEIRPQLQQDTQSLNSSVTERTALRAEIALRQAEVSHASKQAVAEADALAASLDLSPKPTKAGNELTSELISEFLKTIQQLGADTRKLILARMAVQMLDRVIGERYKAQADEANKYHKQALDKMIESFRDQIETSIQQAEATGNSDGQKLAAMSGEHTGIMGDANIRSKVEEILDRTMDISPPIMTDNQKQEILNQLFDGDPSNDTMGLMGIMNNFELQRRTLMARGVSMN